MLIENHTLYLEHCDITINLANNVLSFATMIRPTTYQMQNCHRWVYASHIYI